ncbi:Flp pilus assembly protein, protease CpaA [Pasteurella canis]|uniref:Flp pilus assembly protein, protease CpaA n=1 Tax=Pasteurella canis TaxID=753 RepID=A0A379ETB2_9PAST|nr:Flp pilus assembly protein, protease CpaA [Pasteurella canis]
MDVANGIIIGLQSIIILLLIILSWTDIRSRIISNKIVFILLVVVLPLAWLKHGEINIIPALLVLVIGFILFSFRIIGAGDIKLISVLMLALPNEQIIYFFFFTAFSGLILIIVGLLFFRNSIRKQGLPYGVAIASGFIINLLLFSI